MNKYKFSLFNIMFIMVNSKLHVKLFLLTINLLPLLLSVDASPATHLFVTHVGACATQPPPVVAVKEMLISTDKYDGLLSGELNVTQDVEDGWSVKATMQKCQDIRNTDTCDHFSSHRLVEGGCSGAHEDAYAKVLEHLEPQLQCPILAGVYKLTKYPFRTEDNELTVHESKISTSVFGYLLVIEAVTVDRKPLLCVEAYLQMLYLRRHNWLGKRNHTVSSTQRTTTVADYDDDDT